MFATGAFLGRDVLIGNHSNLTLDSAFINQAPTPEDDFTTVTNSGTITGVDPGGVSVLANDSDPDGHGLSVVPATNVATLNGTLEFINADGTFSYTHDGSDSFADSFTYTVCDDGNPSVCSTALVFLTVLPADVTISVSQSGSGSGTIFSTPAGIDCGFICSGQFEFGLPITLNAVADSDSVFVSWDGPEDCADGVLDGTADVSCTAVFEALTVFKEVVVSLSGTGTGVVTSNPEGINCGEDCVGGFPDFQRVSLQALAFDGSRFAGWGGDEDCLDGVVDQFENTHCIAFFEEVAPTPETTVSVNFSGDGSGRVTSSPEGLDCTSACSYIFLTDNRIELTATPDEGSEFLGWEGDPSCDRGILPGSDVDCTAVFGALPDPPNTFNLRLIIDGSGTASTNPFGLICSEDCNADFEAGLRIRLLVRPDPGWFLLGWCANRLRSRHYNPRNPLVTRT